MPAGELHVQLAVNFPDNRKVRKLNRYGREVRALRDLFVQMCLYSKDNRSDGEVPDRPRCGLLVYPDTEKNGHRDARRLAEVDLLERRDDGWFITGWFDRNPSREAIEHKSAAKARGARLANHRRWHVEYDSPDSQCEWCQRTNQTTDQNTDESRDQSSDQTNISNRVGTAKRSDSKRRRRVRTEYIQSQRKRQLNTFASGEQGRASRSAPTPILTSPRSGMSTRAASPRGRPAKPGRPRSSRAASTPRRSSWAPSATAMTTTGSRAPSSTPSTPARGLTANAGSSATTMTAPRRTAPGSATRRRLGRSDGPDHRDPAAQARGRRPASPATGKRSALPMRTACRA